MAQTHQTLGIILVSEEFGEGHRLYTIFTKDFGKVQAEARGVQKTSSKLAGHLEPFSLSQLFLIQGHHYWRIGGSVIQKGYESLKTDLDIIKVVNHLFFLVDRLTPILLKDEAIFLLLEKTLDEISASGFKKNLIQNFIHQLLKLLGFSLESEFEEDVARVMKFYV